MFGTMKTVKLILASLLISTAVVPLSGAAQAQTAGRSWADSLAAYPPVAESAQPQAKQRATARRVAPVQLSASAPVRASEDCFWCNRKTTISGLSF